MKNPNIKNAVYIFLIALASETIPLQAQSIITKNEKMTNAIINKNGDLDITSSKTSSARDFDFLAGKWTMDNKRLKTRLNNCTEWVAFKSTSDNFGSILDGIGNMDIYKATLDGKYFEGLTVRVFNPKTKLWSLYWVASNVAVMDPPVVGSFEGNVGMFYCKDVFEGKPILVVFKWDKTDPENPVWSQAFSPDNGLTWEWNYSNVSHRVK